MKNIAAILFLAGYLNPAFSQSTPEAHIRTFFEQYKSNKKQAITTLYGTNEWVSRSADAVINIINEAEKLTPDFVGEYHGYEFITQKQLSNCLVLYSYLLRYDRQPVRFTFIFYKPGDKWRIFSFAMDINLDDELEEAAKLYYLQLGN
jgi:hypothetical protein